MHAIRKNLASGSSSFDIFGNTPDEESKLDDSSSLDNSVDDSPEKEGELLHKSPESNENKRRLKVIHKSSKKII